jgi:hypothetical protein
MILSGASSRLQVLVPLLLQRGPSAVVMRPDSMGRTSLRDGRYQGLVRGRTEMLTQPVIRGKNRKALSPGVHEGDLVTTKQRPLGQPL